MLLFTMIVFLILLILGIKMHEESKIKYYSLKNKIKEGFETCTEHKTWSSCIRSVDNRCKWEKDEGKCIIKCSAHGIHNCPTPECKVHHKKCMDNT